MKKVLLTLLVVMPMVSYAEPLTLLQAYQKAQAYDATVRAARADNNAQKEEVNKSFAAFLPQARITAFEGRGVTDSTTPGFLPGQTNQSRRVYGSHNYSFSVRQSIFNYANFASYSQSKAEVAKSDALLHKAEIGMIGRVSGAYFDVLLSSENVHYAEAQRQNAQSQLAQAERRFKVGLGTITEINEAKANLETVIAQGLEWLNGLEYSKRFLENISGVYMDAFYTLDSNKLTLGSPEPNRVESWLEIAQEKSPEIIAGKNEVLSMIQEIEKHNSGHYPTLELIASRTQSKSDNNFTIGSQFETDSIGLQLNVPLYLGGYVSASVRQAVARLDLAQEKLSDKQRSVSAEIRKFFNEVVNGVARVEARTQAVKSNEIALTGTQKGYEAGIRTNVEVLTAQDKFYAAKRDLAAERYKLIYHRLLLKQTAGTITEADINEVNGLLTANSN